MKKRRARCRKKEKYEQRAEEDGGSPLNNGEKKAFIRIKTFITER